LKGPDFLRRKEILFSPKTPEEEAARWGDRYLEARRLHDAAAFYLRARDADGLQRVREAAVATGDLLLFDQAGALGDGTGAPPQELADLARRAEELGRWHEARRAYQRLGDQDGVGRASRALEGLAGAAMAEAAPPRP
jgi:hypothetical protein